MTLSQIDVHEKKCVGGREKKRKQETSLTKAGVFPRQYMRALDFHPYPLIDQATIFPTLALWWAAT